MATPRKTETPTETPHQAAAPDVNGAVQRALDDLRARVANLERHTRAPAPDEAERDEAKRDEELLSRPAVSYTEAVAQEAARKRQAAREGACGASTEGGDS